MICLGAISLGIIGWTAIEAWMNGYRKLSYSILVGAAIAQGIPDIENISRVIGGPFLWLCAGMIPIAVVFWCVRDPEHYYRIRDKIKKHRIIRALVIAFIVVALILPLTPKMFIIMLPFTLLSFVIWLISL